MEPAQQARTRSTPTHTSLGRYRMLQPIGQGGMAEVALAVMPGPARFNKLIVIKTIRDDMNESGDQYAEMFLDEARLAARLSHPNVVQTYEVGEQDGKYFIAMEYLEGQSLRAVQRKIAAQRMPLEARLRILIDVAQGLHHAHELVDFAGKPLHVVHRDVSPQNIFLTYDGQVKLLDFGIAKVRDSDSVTRAGQIKGKVDYMAPEQIRSEVVDRRADVFALGAILWELLAGRQLSGGRTHSEVTRIHNRILGHEPNVREVVPQVDDELAVICDRALALDADARYESALAFAGELQAYVARRSLVATPHQLALLLESEFEDERTRRRERVQAALADLKREEGQPDAALAPDTISTVPPPHREGSEDGAMQAEAASIDGTLSGLASGTRSILRTPVRPAARMLVFAAVALAVALASWLPKSSDPAGSAPTAANPQSKGLQAGTAPKAKQVQQAAVQAPEATQAAESEPTMRLQIRSLTPGATIELDGAELAGLPFERQLQRDGRTHTLTASAPGHHNLTRQLAFDGDQEVVVQLERIKRRIPPVPRRARVVEERPVEPPAVSAPTTAVAAALEEPSPGDSLGTVPRTSRPIDEVDPYL